MSGWKKTRQGRYHRVGDRYAYTAVRDGHDWLLIVNALEQVGSSTFGTGGVVRREFVATYWIARRVAAHLEAGMSFSGAIGAAYDEDAAVTAKKDATKFTVGR